MGLAITAKDIGIKDPALQTCICIRGRDLETLCSNLGANVTRDELAEGARSLTYKVDW